MTIKSQIGWSLDQADKTDAAGGTGTNFVLAKFTAIETLRLAGTPIPTEQWHSACRDLNSWMMGTRPEVFLDGPAGEYVGRLFAALGGDPATIPPSP